MDNKQKKICLILKIGMLISYIILETVFLYGIYTRAGLDGTAISAELADQIAREATIEKVSEICIYILFFIYSSVIWKWESDKRYIKYALNMFSIIFILFLWGCAFAGVQYLLMGSYTISYFMPVILLFILMIAILLMVSGKQAKADMKKEK